MDKDILYVKQRFQNFFAAIVAISDHARPPGTNAANGWMREWVLSDPGIQRLGDDPTLPLSGDAAALFEAYRFNYSYTLRAFRDNTNVWSSGFQSLSVFWDNIGGAIGSVIRTVSALIQLIFGDEKTREQAKENLARSVEALMNDVKTRGTVWNGRHMNGFVAAYMRDAANWTSQHHLDGKFMDQNTDAGKLAEILRQTFRQVAALQTEGHNPWLNAEWQVRFQTILTASVIALASLS
ncbi:MAG: hypothetical protein JSR64_13245 [Nitrospira sp.]|nr:hypothetical protein [Nitrospira sp.]